MKRVGIVGWRGMVGSVLMERMRAEGDFNDFEPVFFSTSQAGDQAPEVGKDVPALQDARDLETLKPLDVIVTCQGGGYTGEMYPKLRDAGWNGYWIDAASTLRMEPGSVIVLDPVNRPRIEDALAKGIKDFIGGNCTVSLMLMAVGGLLREGLVEWVTAMTYQAASGAGAKNMRELLAQMGAAHNAVGDQLQDPAASILEIDRTLTAALNGGSFPTQQWGYPLAGSLLPWIDADLGNGRSREEWKGHAETNKILGLEDTPLPIDGICVRIGAMRSHSQALTLKLTRDVPLDEVRDIIGTANDWVQVVPNEKESTLSRLTPAVVTGTLDVPVGRVRKMAMGGEYLSAFTVGDQLLWGAAEPLRRMLRILLES